MDLSPIEKQTKLFAEARQEVTTIVTNLNRNLDALRNAARKDIKAAVAKVAERRSILYSLIDGARQLFAKPKTQIFHDIKVGLRKGAGGITWEDDDATVIARIKKMMPKQADLLIKTKETINKDALKGLTVEELASIGCVMEGVGDVIVITPVDSDTEKAVKAMLKTLAQNDESEAA